MKNRVLIGGLIALAVIVLMVILCLWAGKSAFDRLRGVNNANISSNTNPPPVNPKNSSQPTSPEQAQKIYLALGNPSNATNSTANANNYLMVSNFYAVSYNRDRALPNWVAWRVTKADMGNLDRVDSFRPDDRLPNGWARVTPSDYTGNGYDRGHVCPNADRNGNSDAMASTFLMTNMTPQTPDLNRGPWEKLESYLRTLVTRGSDVYIIAGTYGEKGKLKNKVTIPTNDWKVAVAVPAGSEISTAVNQNTRIIAVDMPNVKGIKMADWQTYRTTVRDIEQKTGLSLLSGLSPDTATALKSKKDNISD